MKKQLLAVFISLAAFSAQAQWINQNVPFGYEGYINDIRITDVNTVWGNAWDALATDPYTQNWVRTIDGGNVWTSGSVGAPSQYVISNIWPIDADTCYVSMCNLSAADGAVFKTTNGGAAWSQVGSNMFGASSSFANVVYFWDAQNGMVMGDPIGAPLKYELWLTNDYGNTWTPVDPANIPTLTNSAEYGITNLFDAADGRVWFATTYGDVYRTIDNGLTWTKSASGFPSYIPTGTTSRQDISNIAFSDSLHGLIMQVDANNTIIRLKSTVDGGLTWTDVAFTGTLFGGDITGIPGTTGSFVSAGSNATFGFGTSFTLDNGATWLEIDNNISHTAVEFLDSVTGWTGEYITAASVGGAWKFDGALATITCSDPNIYHGDMTVNDSSICFNDTLTVTTVGVLAPTEGAVHGFSVLLSSVDISGNSDPIGTGAVVGGTGVIHGTPPPTVLLNDQTVFPPGVYYFTPIVYGNATDPAGQGNSYDLVYDPNCTFTGTSVYVNLLDFGDPQCIDDGISDFTLATLSVKAYQSSPDMISININAVKSDNHTLVNIFDLTGRNVFTNTYQVAKGLNVLPVPASNLSSGTYLIQTVSGGSVVTTKITKL